MQRRESSRPGATGQTSRIWKVVEVDHDGLVNI